MTEAIKTSEERRRERREGERGIALILAMLVLAILIVLVTQFAWSTQVERTIAKNSRDELKMLMAARGSLAYTRAWLRADRVKGGRADSLREDWAGESNEMPERSITIGDVAIRLKIEDTERFLNVNLFNDPAAKTFAVGTLTRLAERLQIEEGAVLVERIADYLDEDSEGQYEAGARNQPLTHADELLGMRGLTPVDLDALAGRPMDPVTGAEAKRGLLEFMTAAGKRTLNINTASEDLLWAMLPEKNQQGQEIDRDAAITKITEFRTGATASEDGTGTSAGTSAGASTGAGSAAADANERPGKDFNTVDELQQIEGLAGILPPQAGGGGGAGAGAGGAAPAGTTGTATAQRSLRQLLGVDAQDFRVTVGASRAGLTKTYEVVIRRGNDRFDVLIWREKPAPPAPLPNGSGL